MNQLHTSSRLVLSLGLITMYLCAVAGSGEPPPVGLPIGFKEWQQTGQFPREIVLKKRDQGLQVALSTPGTRLPLFVVQTPANRDRRLLTLSDRDQVPLPSALYNRSGFTFDVGRGDIIPIYDELYCVSLGEPDNVVLSRVTDQVPAQFRPAGKARTISLAAVDDTLFWVQDAKFKDRHEFDLVSLEIDEKTSQAKITLTPRVSSEQGKGTSKATPMVLTVAKDELLSARGRAYKVLNVVPPQGIDGVGRLVGWIEISADPVEPTEK